MASPVDLLKRVADNALTMVRAWIPPEDSGEADQGEGNLLPQSSSGEDAREEWQHAMREETQASVSSLSFSTPLFEVRDEQQQQDDRPRLSVDLSRKRRAPASDGSDGDDGGGGHGDGEGVGSAVSAVVEEGRRNLRKRPRRVVSSSGAPHSVRERRRQSAPEVHKVVEVVDLISSSPPSFRPAATRRPSTADADAALARQLQHIEDSKQQQGPRTRRRAAADAAVMYAPPEPPRGPSPVKLVYPWDEQTGEALPGSVTIHECDVALLQPQMHLNDNLIEFYLKFIHREVLREGDRRRFHFFTPHFYSALKQRGFDGVRRWLRNVDIFEKDFLVIPINELEHWKVVVVVRPLLALQRATEKKQSSLSKVAPGQRTLISLGTASGTSSRVVPAAEPESNLLMFDSLGTDYLNPFKRIRDWLAHVYASKYNLNRSTDVKFGPKSLEGIAVKAPTQPNDFDCGVYLLQYMDKFCRQPDTPLHEITPDWFNIEDIADMRVNIVSCIERQVALRQVASCREVQEVHKVESVTNAASE